MIYTGGFKLVRWKAGSELWKVPSEQMRWLTECVCTGLSVASQRSFRGTTPKSPTCLLMTALVKAEGRTVASCQGDILTRVGGILDGRQGGQLLPDNYTLFSLARAAERRTLHPGAKWRISGYRRRWDVMRVLLRPQGFHSYNTHIMH